MWYKCCFQKTFTRAFKLPVQVSQWDCGPEAWSGSLNPGWCKLVLVPHLPGCLKILLGHNRGTKIFDFFLNLQFLFTYCILNNHFLRKKKGVKIWVKFGG